MTFQEKLLMAPVDKTTKLAESSETTIQRNSLKGCNPQVVNIPQILRGTSGIQLPETVKGLQK
jgi:hypothetical protein